MEMPRAHPRWGIEFDWLGVDQRGHVALFTTAGHGPVPENVNLHLNDVDHAIERLRRLPVIGEADHIVKQASDRNYTDWYAYSAQARLCPVAGGRFAGGVEPGGPDALAAQGFGWFGGDFGGPGQDPG
jgi:hypothetical protein